MDPFVVDARPAGRATLRGSWAAGRRRSRRPGASGSSAGSAGCCRSGAAAWASTSTSPRRGRSSTPARCSSRCPRARSAGRPAGSGRSGPAGRSSPCASTRRSCPWPWPAPRSCTSAGGWPRASCPPTTVRDLAGLPDGAPLPEPGSREELDLARQMTERPGGPPRPGRRGAPPVDRRPADAPAPPAQAPDLAAAPPRPPRPRRLSAHSRITAEPPGCRPAAQRGKAARADTGKSVGQARPGRADGRTVVRRVGQQPEDLRRSRRHGASMPFAGSGPGRRRVGCPPRRVGQGRPRRPTSRPSHARWSPAIRERHLGP